MKFFHWLAVAALWAFPGWALAGDMDGSTLPLWWGVPFAGILLSIALIPLLAPIFWHHHFGKVVLGWSLAFLLPFATAYGMDLNAFAQTQGYTDADAMLAASDAYFEHLAKQDLILQAVAETKSLAPTQEELDDAESTYADTYGENRAHLNALQSCVLDWLEENSTVA